MKRRDWLRVAVSSGTAAQIPLLGLAASAASDLPIPADVPDGPDADYSPMPPLYPRVAPIATINGDGARVRAVAISSDGSTVVTAEEGRAVFKVWDGARGTELVVSPEHTGPISSLALAPDGRRVASAARAEVPARADGPPRTSKETLPGESVVRISDVASGRPIRECRGVGGMILGLSLTSAGRPVALASDGMVYSWDDGDRGVPFLADRTGALSRGVVFEPAQSGFGVDAAGQRAVSLNHGARIENRDQPEHLISLWDRQARASRFLDAEVGPIASVAISPDGSRLLAASIDQLISVFEFETGRRLFRFYPGPNIGGVGPFFLACSPDGTRFLHGKRDGGLRVYVSSSSKYIDSARGPKAFIRAVAFMGDRLRVVSGGVAEARFNGVPSKAGPRRYEPLWIWDLIYVRSLHGGMETFRPPRR